MHRSIPRPTARSAAALALLVASSTAACDAGTPTDTAADTTGAPAASSTSSASPSSSTSAPSSTAPPTGSGGAPAAWPSGVPLPTAVDPSGASIPGSLVTDDDPPAGDVVLFTFAQGERTALQSAFTGVGHWAEDSFEDFPGGSPCSKDEASSAALAGGSWSCDGMLPDGRLVQLATSIRDGRLSLDVLIKTP